MPDHASQANPRLSTELIIHILRFTDPIAILAVRKCCREFYAATQVREVWLDALHGVCETHGVFKPTYPFEKMTRFELEHAATSPYRFVRSIEHREDNEESLIPYQSRVLQPRYGPTPGSTHFPVALHLVPGGRFLFTGGIDDFCLWDLGFNSTSRTSTFMKHLPIARMESSVLQDIGPSADGKAVILATKSPSLSDDHKVKIYRVYPSNPEPGFELLGELDMGGLGQQLDPIKTVQISGEAVLIWSDWSFVIWNWQEERGCSWEISVDLGRGSKIYTCDRSVIASDASGRRLYVWDIPQTREIRRSNQLLELGDIDETENQPKSVIPAPGYANNQIIAISGTPNWQRRGPAGEHLCLMLDEGSVKNLQLYSIRQCGTGDPFLPASCLVEAGRRPFAYNDMPYQFASGMTALHFCADRLLFCSSSERNSLVATTMAVPTRASQDDVPATSVDLTSIEMVLTNVSDQGIVVCPMSGRVVYYSSHALHFPVNDYVLPPLQDPERPL
ncbi:hypothetical protein D9611_013313 [Ephemerocybe angulata]|uniref:F-box domain-containing protein n=1 Tax=Ephemerocybe angulata TaxID=980116 RepID=A0A8H5CB58_9AGAR|nr:hypothetical protein D9611_013313 [Tulosesus angulatus]